MKQTTFLIALLLGSCPGNAQTNTNSITIEQVAGEVLKENRSLKSARAAWQAMTERAAQERAWSDPRTGVDIERSGTARIDTFTDNEWMISQEIPISGKNRLRGQAAEAEANASRGTVRRRELELVTLARTAFYRYANAFALADLNRRDEDLLKQFAESSREKYRLGLRSQAEVLIAETELAKNSEALRDIEQQLSEQQSRLNALMHRAPQTPLPRPEVRDIPFPDYDQARAQSMALKHRPEIDSALAKLQAAKFRQRLACRAWIPDPELRVEARQFNGSGKAISEYDTGIFFNIPWVNRGKYKAAAREAAKERESMQEEVAGLQIETLAMVRDQLKRIETLHHHYDLYQTKIVPLARQAVQASLTAYASDKASLLDLLAAQRNAREAESLLQQHRTDYLIAVGEMEALIGTNPTAQLTEP